MDGTTYIDMWSSHRPLSRNDIVPASEMRAVTVECFSYSPYRQMAAVYNTEL
jgi:hypothetical protein